MQKARHRVYLFDTFTLDLTSGSLLREGRGVKLRPKSFQMLCYFVENGGRLIGKEELIEALWPDSFVTDDSLVKCLKDVRRALGGDTQQFVKTVPRRGYIFVATVNEKVQDNSGLLYTEQAEGRSVVFAREQQEGLRVPGADLIRATKRVGNSPRTLAAVMLLIALAAGFSYVRISRRSNEPTAVRAFNSIAVLPFKPLGVDNQDESLEMGMAETLITKLCSIKQIVVRPMGAVRKYTDPRQDPVSAGKELDVEAVLAGSIQKAGDRVRVTVQLMNVRTGAALWGEQFDADFRDIFEIQDSISERVIHALTLSPSGEESARLARHYTENPEAYQLYLQGNYLFAKQTGDRGDNLRRSLEYYHHAVKRDPKFARAYVGIAEFYISGGPDPKLTLGERSLQARSAVIKALELDETLAEAHIALAELKYQYEFEWSGADAEFKRALDLDPNVAYSHLAYSWYQMCLGRFDQAQAELSRAQELEPGSLRINKTQGVLFLFMRRYDEAISHYQKMREVEPNLIHRNQFSMSVAYEQVGMQAEAVEEFLEDGRTRWFLIPEETEALRKAFRASGWDTYNRMRINLLEEKAKRQYIAPTILAGLYALSGRNDQAFDWLQKALDTRDPWLSLIKIQPAYDSLRSDPRFKELLRGVGLPQ